MKLGLPREKGIVVGRILLAVFFEGARLTTRGDSTPNLWDADAAQYVRDELNAPQTAEDIDVKKLLFILSDAGGSRLPWTVDAINALEFRVEAGIRAAKNWDYCWEDGEERFEAFKLFSESISKKDTVPTVLTKASLHEQVLFGSNVVGTVESPANAVDWAFEYQDVKDEFVVTIPVLAMPLSMPSRWIVVKRVLNIAKSSTPAERYALLLNVGTSLRMLVNDLDMYFSDQEEEEVIKKIKEFFKVLCPPHSDLLQLFEQNLPLSRIIRLARVDLAVMKVDELISEKVWSPDVMSDVSELKHSVRCLLHYYLKVLVSTTQPDTEPQPFLSPSRVEIDELAGKAAANPYYHERWNALRHLIRVANHNPAVCQEPFQIQVEGNYYTVDPGRQQDTKTLSFENFTSRPPKDGLPLLDVPVVTPEPAIYSRMLGIWNGTPQGI